MGKTWVRGHFRKTTGQFAGSASGTANSKLSKSGKHTGCKTPKLSKAEKMYLVEESGKSIETHKIRLDQLRRQMRLDKFLSSHNVDEVKMFMDKVGVPFTDVDFPQVLPYSNGNVKGGEVNEKLGDPGETRVPVKVGAFNGCNEEVGEELQELYFDVEQDPYSSGNEEVGEELQELYFDGKQDPFDPYSNGNEELGELQELTFDGNGDVSMGGIGGVNGHSRAAESEELEGSGGEDLCEESTDLVDIDDMLNMAFIEDPEIDNYRNIHDEKNNTDKWHHLERASGHKCLANSNAHLHTSGVTLSTPTKQLLLQYFPSPKKTYQQKICKWMLG